MVSVEDSSIRGGGNTLKQALWDAARTTLEEWTGQELTECSLYGIRVYTEGAVLNTHVDRLPLVSSAILNVAQDTDEPWPLEVIGHDGKAYNVTMEPGEMILYESHSILHGRPFPLKGKYMANVFIHFEPTGHSLKHHGYTPSEGDVGQQYRKSSEKGSEGLEGEEEHTGLPPYLLPDSPEAASYKGRHPAGNVKSNLRRRDTNETDTTAAHLLAAKGNIEELLELLAKETQLVDAKDYNGWTPLLEGARGGHIDVVKALVDKGANINARSHDGTGGTALYYAKAHHGEDSAVYQFLESMGAVEIGPEL